jgi:hypothetical protein
VNALWLLRSHQRHNCGVDQRLLQGWHADPFGLHEQRYFSVGRPTKLVRDGWVEAYDEPPAREVPADGVAADGYGGRPEPAGVTAQGGGYPTRPHRGGPDPRRRTGLVNTVVALVAVAAIVTFVAIEGGFSPRHGPKSHAGSSSPGVNLAAFVTRSAEQTLAQKTADVSLTAKTEIDGSEVDLQGKGQIDLAANTFAFNLSASFSGNTFAEREIMTSQALYIEVAVNGQSLAQYLGGKPWMEIPIAPSATQNNEPQLSPAGSLQLLEQQGARVTAIGSRTVGGLTCSGYAVTPSQQAMVAAAQQEWSEAGLSSSEIAAARQVVENSTPPTISVWLDPTRQLVCELDIATQLGAGTPAGSGSAPATERVQLALTFTHYGVRVDITPPAQSETAAV